MRPVLLLAALAFAAGCRSAPDDRAGSTLRVYTTETLEPVARRQAELFMRRYPGTRVDLATRTTRGAVVALLADSARLIYIDRPLNAEEQAAADARPDTLRLDSVRIGMGALALVVHPENPIAQVPLAALAGLVRRAGAAWAQAVPGGPGAPVELAVTGRNSGTYELLARRFLPGPGELAPAFVGATPADVLRFVARRPHALGVVPLEALRDSAAVGVKTLAVGEGAAAVRPSQLAVYRGTYPLRYEAYVYKVRRYGGPIQERLAALALLPLGQRAVQRAGLVPVTIPARQIVLAEDDGETLDLGEGVAVGE